MSVRRRPHTDARAARAAPLAVHRPLHAVLAAGREHSRASAPTGRSLGDFKYAAWFTAPGTGFGQVSLSFNAPLVEPGEDRNEAWTQVQIDLYPQLRDVLYNLSNDENARQKLTGVDAYFKVGASAKIGDDPDDVYLLLTPEDDPDSWFDEPWVAALRIGNTSKNWQFWERIYTRRKEGDLTIEYFDSGTDSAARPMYPMMQ